MTHRKTASFCPVTKGPQDDVRLRTLCGVVCSLLSPAMVVSASDLSYQQHSTIAGAVS